MTAPDPTTARHSTEPARRRAGLAEVLLRVVAAAGLAYDAYSHFDLAGTYEGSGGAITQATLFRIEAVLAVLAALGVLLVRRKIVTFAALLVAAGGLAVLLLYRYVDVGVLGPLPNMYEPVWYPKKTWSAISMAVASLALLILLLRRSPGPNGAKNASKRGNLRPPVTPP
ncbi:MAG: hypothetical protein H0W01_17580 [Pseudonocardiales bacterium]|nr:hypothetical protein [Pseudonocardiales bacterium]